MDYLVINNMMIQNKSLKRLENILECGFYLSIKLEQDASDIDGCYLNPCEIIDEPIKTINYLIKEWFLY